MSDLFEAVERVGAGRVLMLSDPSVGLRAFLVLDDLTLGPACGGIRTQRYRSDEAALDDAHRLASAMTLKCAIAGAPAGGGKTVVMDHDGMDRGAAFRRLGEFVEELGGLYRCAGDLGTTFDDLLAVAESTAYVDTTGATLGQATGTGIVHCIRAVARDRGRDTLDGLRVAIQGCGLIGAGVARMLAAEGAVLVVADVDPARARALADEVGATVAAADAILLEAVDIVSPCAIGGVLDAATVARMQAWGICGGANNQLAMPAIAEQLVERGIAYVPDFLASAGAVIEGAARMFPQTGPAAPLLERLGTTTSEVLARARAERTTTPAVAAAIARSRIAAARAHRR